MATSRLSPTSGQCLVKAGLIADLYAAHQSIMRLHMLELAALTHMDLDADRKLTVELIEAETKRKDILQAIRDHMARHGC